MKVKLTGAKKGHSLLKKKADALTMRLRALLKNILQVRPVLRLARRIRRLPPLTSARLPAHTSPLRMCIQAKDDMGSAFREGNFALAEVKYAAGDIKPMVIESVGSAQKRVEIRVDNIAGVKVPVFKSIDTGAVSQDHTGAMRGSPCANPSPARCPLPPRRPRASSRDACLHHLHGTPRLCSHTPPLGGGEWAHPADELSTQEEEEADRASTRVHARLAGLSKGGQQIARARTTFSKAVDVLVQLATLQSSFTILDEAIKVTSRRVNALDTVVVPRIHNTVEYIKSELDEL